MAGQWIRYTGHGHHPTDSAANLLKARLDVAGVARYQPHPQSPPTFPTHVGTPAPDSTGCLTEHEPGSEMYVILWQGGHWV
ncbi:hypothetical protein GDO81_000168 [Engystomops pustulosus]|uniref:Uncharacterized protein n=1 Tax=Engystomops pustulosus TaxID=76066 RepID=A0AAV7D2K8_ENGPU|nr:hypothetical protein GDO81_000168 [Engystomops pustulosus]